MEQAILTYRYAEPLAAVGMAEPSIALVENDSAFGLLISESAQEEEALNSLHLSQVLLLRVWGKEWATFEFQQIRIAADAHGIWTATNPLTGEILREPSPIPYRVIFLSMEDYRGLQAALADAAARRVFAFAQHHFGNLPGFSYNDNVLTTPDQYATAYTAYPNDRFFCPKW